MKTSINAKVVTSEIALIKVRMAQRLTYCPRLEWPVERAVIIGYQNRNSNRL